MTYYRVKAAILAAATHGDIDMRHTKPEDCPYEWAESWPHSYGPEYRVFSCGCSQPDVHLVKASDQSVSVGYDPESRRSRKYAEIVAADS